MMRLIREICNNEKVKVWIFISIINTLYEVDAYYFIFWIFKSLFEI